MTKKILLILTLSIFVVLVVGWFVNNPSFFTRNPIRADSNQFTKIYPHSNPDRCNGIRKLIITNKHANAPFSEAINADTLQVLGSWIDEQDIPCLISLVNDKDKGVSSAAGYGLGILGEKGVSALQSVASSSDHSSAAAAQARLFDLSTVTPGSLEQYRKK